MGTGADTGGGNRGRELDEGAEGPATWRGDARAACSLVSRDAIRGPTDAVTAACTDLLTMS